MKKLGNTEAELEKANVAYIKKRAAYFLFTFHSQEVEISS